MVRHQLTRIDGEKHPTTQYKWPYEISLRPPKEDTLKVIKQVALDAEELSLARDDPAFQDVIRTITAPRGS